MTRTWTDQEIRRWFDHFIQGYLARRNPSDGWNILDDEPACEAGLDAWRSELSPEMDGLDVSRLSEHTAIVRGLYTVREQRGFRPHPLPLSLTAVLSCRDGRCRAHHLHVSHSRCCQHPEMARSGGLLDHLPGFLGLLSFEDGWKLDLVEGGFLALTGFLPVEWTGGGRPADGLVDPDYREAVRSQWAQALARGDSFQGEYPLVRADGSTRWVWEQGRGIPGLDGAPPHLELFVTDITERKEVERGRLELEKRLMQAEKLESLGILAAGVAHDYNNLLMAMMGNLDLLAIQLPAGNPLRVTVDRCMSAARKAADLTGQMLACSGNRPLLPKPVDLIGLLEENEALLREVVPEKVCLMLEGRRNQRRMLGDASQVLQVALTLVTNAAEAIGAAPGLIHVCCEERFLTAVDLAASRIEVSPREGWYVILQVEDSGCGMDPETLQHLFDPFFSTKFFGRGLGLPAALGIIRGHQGAIMLESRPDQGTCFQACFPAIEEAQPR
nr:ATP-binding protein [uncultured Holophaga sp.]